MIPKVSVIVPVYGVEKYLTRCVESIRNQTLREIEIILVDDESPDNCPAMCDAFAAQDSRIHVIHKKNGGLGYARNSGIELASGEYIAFVDSDDYIDTEMYECMYRAALDNKSDYVHANRYYETPEGNLLNGGNFLPMRGGRYDQQELRETILYPMIGLLPHETGRKYVSCSVCWSLYRREIILGKDLRFLSERKQISEDLLFNIDYLMECNCAYVINQKFYHYMVNENSLTQSYRSDRFEKEIILFHTLEEKLKRIGIYQECEIRLYRHLLDRMRRCIKGELYGNTETGSLRHTINGMVHCKEVEHVYEVYPIRKMQPKYSIAALLMKYNCVFALLLLRKKL